MKPNATNESLDPYVGPPPLALEVKPHEKMWVLQLNSQWFPYYVCHVPMVRLESGRVLIGRCQLHKSIDTAVMFDTKEKAEAAAQTINRRDFDQ